MLYFPSDQLAIRKMFSLYQKRGIKLFIEGVEEDSLALGIQINTAVFRLFKMRRIQRLSVDRSEDDAVNDQRLIDLGKVQIQEFLWNKTLGFSYFAKSHNCIHISPNPLVRPLVQGDPSFLWHMNACHSVMEQK